MKLKALKKKEYSKVLEQIDNKFGSNVKEEMIENYCFYISEKNKIYIIDNKIKEIDLKNIRINNLGLYFCELNNGNIRFSIDGSQIVGKTATKNLINLDDKLAKRWLKGEDIETEEEFENFVLIKNNDNFLGCGKYNKESKKIFNYVPKGRRDRSKD